MTWRPFLFVVAGVSGAVAVLCVELVFAASRVTGAVMDGTSRAILVLFYFPMLLTALALSARFLGPIIEHSTRSERSVAVRCIFLISTQVAWMAFTSCLALVVCGEPSNRAFYFVVCRVTVPFLVAATVTSALGIYDMRKLSRADDQLPGSSELKPSAR